jgi:hypothetical protein
MLDAMDDGPMRLESMSDSFQTRKFLYGVALAHFPVRSSNIQVAIRIPEGARSKERNSKYFPVLHPAFIYLRTQIASQSVKKAISLRVCFLCIASHRIWAR